MRPESWITPQWNAPAHIKACVTSREGGYSRGAYASMNLALHVGDEPKTVEKNRARLRQILNLPAEPAWLGQVHGRDVVELGTAPASPVRADGCVTFSDSVVCAVMTADCLPVLLTDQSGSCVAAVHAGWRGLAGGVVEQAVQTMDRHPRTLLAWLGPAIGPQAFEVGDEVRRVFIDHHEQAKQAFAPSPGGCWLADIYALAALRLRELGVSDISGGGYCTYQQAERFYSYRRDSKTGRMASLIWMARQ